MNITQLFSSTGQAAQRSPRSRRWIGHSLVGVLLAVALLATLTFLAGQAARARLRSQYPAPGQLIDVGGHRMHLNCQGSGTPVVILEAGVNDFSVFWAKVQPEVARMTQVCAYDRAGLGWSEASTAPRSPEEMAKELRALLSNAGVEGPYVLVGHSFGGIITRAFTRQAPGDVLGLVWVDSAHEQMAARAPALARAAVEGMGQFRTLRVINSLGLTALSPEQVPARGLSGEVLAQYRARMAATDFFDAALAETEGLYGPTGEKRLEPPAPLGDLPLIVLSRAQPDTLPGFSAADNQQYEAAWRAMQIELAGLSTNSRQIIAERSGHYIQLDQPELVVEAIREMVESLRQTATSLD